MQFAATHFDGRSAGSIDGTLEVSANSIRFHAAGDDFFISPDSSRLVGPVGSGPWTIELAGGGSIHVNGADAGKQLTAAYRQGTLVERLENSWPWAVAALVVAVAGSWAFLTFGVPVVAREVAFAMPDEIHASLGAESLEALDRFLFSDTELPEDRREVVRQLFESIPAAGRDSNGYELHFRASPIVGANAFAIPGGQVVITDEMLALTESDDEVVGVLAHEVGHLVHRHGLRILLQDSLSALLIASLTGDLSNISSLAAAAPTLLMQAKYSRDFEREADDFAFAYLEANDLDTDALAKLLERVEAEYNIESSDGISEWFSSHPPSAERKPEPGSD